MEKKDNKNTVTNSIHGVLSFILYVYLCYKIVAPGAIQLVSDIQGHPVSPRIRQDQPLIYVWKLQHFEGACWIVAAPVQSGPDNHFSKSSTVHNKQ